jgi:uncharacterized protein YlxP (DUF503 family)
MEVGMLTVQIHLHAAESLKDKRRVVRSLIEKARARHNVAAAEADHQDLLQRAEVVFLGIASSRDAIERMFDQIVGEAERSVPGDVMELDREFLG